MHFLTSSVYYGLGRFVGAIYYSNRCFPPPLGWIIAVARVLNIPQAIPKSQFRLGADNYAIVRAVCGNPYCPPNNPFPCPKHHHHPRKSATDCASALPWALWSHVHVLWRAHCHVCISGLVRVCHWRCGKWIDQHFAPLWALWYCIFALRYTAKLPAISFPPAQHHLYPKLHGRWHLQHLSRQPHPLS